MAISRARLAGSLISLVNLSVDTLGEFTMSTPFLRDGLETKELPMYKSAGFVVN